MRTGWNPRLAELLQRPDPVARLIPEAVVTAAEDVRRRRDEWEEGSVSGTVRYLDSGGVRLEGQVAEYVTQTTRGGWIRELGADDFHAARLLWGGRRDGAITRIRAWLHPRFDGAQPQEVAWWECRIWALARYRRAEFGPTVYLSLAQLASSRVEAGGGEGEVLFDFAAPVDPTVIYPEDVSGIGTYPNPVIFVQIVALKADGSPAGNVGWAIDPDRTSLTQGPGVTLTGWTLERAGSGPGESPFLGWWKDDVAPEPVPYIIVEHDDLDPATITFSGAAQIDLGAPPPPGTAVEFVAQGEAPAGSALLFEVLADNGTTWVPVRDGQTTDDLPGVSPRRTYAMRVTLTPSPAGDVSPIARDIGARTVRRWTLLGLAEVRMGTSWGFDPLTFRGSIPTATVTLIRDGARDYSDFATELLSQHAPGDIEIRLWVGSERLPRSDWLLLDVFELEDYDPQPAAIHLHCISPAARLRAAQLPPLDEVRKVREPLVYTNQSLAAVYADLLDGQIALPERYRGPGVPDTSTLVSKRITEGDGKTELDAIAYLAGGAVIASQGVVKWIDVAGAAGLRAVFPAEEITVLGASPGLRQATPEWIVPWDWSDEEGRFRGEVPVHHLPALEAVRAGRLDAPQRLDDGIARWIHEEAHARRIGLRHVTWFGAGLIQLHFRTEYPHPYLEPGDLVLVELRDFVARDPNTARALRGQLWAIATVNEVADPLGREFLAWVRSYADLIPTAEAYERIGDVAPEVLAIERSVDKDGRVSLVVYGNTMAGYIRAAATTGSSFPDDQVDAAPAVPGRVAAFNDLIQIGPADVARISVRAYERSDGQGAASEIVHAIAVHPRIGTPAVQARVQLNSSRDAANVFLTPDSPIGEALRVHLRDSDAAGAPVWSLVQGNGSATPRFVADGTEIGPDSWFYNGSQWAQKLSAVALSRDQIRRIYVQAEGQLSGLRSSWIPIPLELRAQPWLESVTAAWNDAGDSIEVTAIGGAHCQSARYELSKDGFATAPAYQRDVSLSDNERKTEAFLIPESDRRASWRARVIPHNGPLTSGQASGLAGAPQEAAVPPLPPTAVQIAPRALLRILEYTDLLDAVVQITGVAGGMGAEPPTQYRWRQYADGTTPGSYSSWTALDSNRQATVTVARRPKGFLIVEAQVRTASGLQSDPVTVRVAPTDGWQDDETGGPKWSFIIDDDGGQMALVNEAASKGQNLLGPDAGLERHVTSNYSYLGVQGFSGVPIATLGLLPGEVISGAIDVAVHDMNVGPFIEFRDQDQNLISQHFNPATPIGDGTYKRCVLEGVTIPANAVHIVFSTANVQLAVGGANIRRATLNRGPKALPFEEPPLRPNRETLADVAGPLREGTGMLEGSAVHQLFRHGEVIMVSGSPNGELDVPFGQAYEDAPAVSLAGFRCITFKDDPTFPGDQRLMIHAEVDEDSVKSVAKLISVSGTVTRQSNNFPLGNALIALGGATEVTLTPAGAIGGIYVVHYSVSVTAFPITEAPRNSINIKVAIETWHGSAWIERAVYTYSAATSGTQRTNTWPHEQKQIVASNLVAGNKIRLVIKDVTTEGDGGGFTVHGFDGVGDPDHGVTYETADTAERAISAIPSASDYVKWLVQAIS